MSMNNKIVLVTGGAGFIGSHLVDRLVREKPEKIIVLSNFFLGTKRNLRRARKNFENLEIINCDVSDYDSLLKVFTKYKVDIVFNLAVIPLPTSLVKPEWTVETNIKMTLNICQLMRENYFSKLIQYSSSEAFGTLKYVPMDLKHPLIPETPYAASKAATDHIALSYHRTFGHDVTVVMPFNQYGPRQNAKKYAGIIPLMIKKMANQESVEIFGDGNQTRDFCYVKDTADATVKIALNDSLSGKTVLIGSGIEISINFLVQSLSKLLNYDKPIVYSSARPGDVRRHLADISYIKDIIGWTPQTSIEDGLKNTVDWYLRDDEFFNEK